MLLTNKTTIGRRQQLKLQIILSQEKDRGGGEMVG